ncbi:MAG: GFA family protein [Planctomycetota bacterium]|nr:MAG: GFA family protein [Planctomycetota bacterium]
MADPSTQSLQGHCLCGRIRFQAQLPAKGCANCHCQNCRRAHGAAFVTYAGFPFSQFQWLAGEEDLVRYRTETDATRSFCRHCGTTLCYEGPRWPDAIHIALAVLEDSELLQPSAHVYVDHGAPWHHIGDDLPHYGGTTGMEAKDPQIS